MPALRALEHLLLPNACVACDRPVGDPDGDALVCSACRWRLRPVLGGCLRCRQPLPPIGPCRFCAAWPPELRWVRSAVWLGEEAREIVHHLKYEGYRALAGDIADVTRRFVPAPEGSVLIPVPLSRRRARERGYNQAALIAGALGERWGLPVREDLLLRVREATSQTGLTPEQRAANVAAAFTAGSAVERWGDVGDAAREGEGGGAAAAVIIVDDVLTTGATLCAVASSLVDGGWTDIGAVTFARALPFEHRLTLR